MKQSVIISPASVNHLTVANLQDEFGTLLDTTSASVKATVTSAGGVQVLAPTALSYQSASQTWTLDIAASVWVQGTGPWTIQVQVYDQAGATLYTTFWLLGQDSTTT